MKGNDQSLNQIIELSVNEIFVFSADTLKFVYGNAASRLHLGYSIAELKERTPLDIKPDYTLDSFQQLIAPLATNHDLTKSIVFETRHKCKNGTTYPVEIKLQRSIYDDLPVYVAFGVDLSAKKETEKLLRENQARFELAERIAQIGSWEANLVEHNLYWSDELYRIFNLEPGQIVPAYESGLEQTHPDDRTAVAEAYAKSLETQTPYNIEHRLLLKDGSLKIVKARCMSYFADDGTPVRSVGTVQDITDQKHRETALQRFRAAIDASPDSIYFTDVESMRFLYVNRVAAQRTGYSQDELLEQGPEKILKYSREQLQRTYDEAIAAGEQGTVTEVEVLVKNDNSRRWSEVRRHAIQLDGRWVVITISRNIDNRKKRDDEMAQFRAAMDASADSIYVTDRDSMRFLYVNKMAAQLVGYTQEQLIQMGPHDVLRSDVDEIKRAYDAVIAAGPEGTVSESKIRSAGDGFSISELRRTALFLNNRWIIITIAQDISARKRSERQLKEAHEQLEHRVEERTRELQLEIEQRKIFETNLKISEERFHDIAASSADGFWETDSSLTFTYIEEQFLSEAAIDPASFPGLATVRSNIKKTSTPEWKQYKDQLASHLPFRNYQFGHKNLQGKVLFFTISGTPVIDAQGEFKGYRGAISDVSARVESERLMQQALNEMLLAKEMAEKASLAKTEFLASMSHELRTPMNSILGFAQLLEANEAALDDRQKLYLRHILASGEHLLHLITDVLELNTIEQGRMAMHFDHVSALDAITECLTQIQLRAKEHNIQLVNRCADSPPPEVWSDATRLKQLLLNLLSNAVKYNEDGGTVTISCKEVADNRLRFSVADTSAGISLENQRKLFLPFERLGREAGTIEGTGIGLSISKRIVELMGGAIGFESEEGRGSTFWIEIPRSKERGLTYTSGEFVAATEVSPIRETSQTQGLLLYIEDNIDNMSLMKHILIDLPGVKMLSAENAELGIDLARKHHPDIILMDINLPGMSGIEAVQQLKQMEDTKAIPVIALSADATTTDIEAALKYGFESYITKPINVKELQRNITQQLSRPAAD